VSESVCGLLGATLTELTDSRAMFNLNRTVSQMTQVVEVVRVDSLLVTSRNCGASLKMWLNCTVEIKRGNMSANK
jgi:hypothetical protein